MLRQARLLAVAAALGSPGCGVIGLDLLDLPASTLDGGEPADGGSSVGEPDGTGPSATHDATVSDAARDAAADASADGAALNAAPDAGDAAVVASDAASDAAVMSCAVGTADCDGSPASCETQLGTVSNCLSCGDACPANGGTATCTATGCATTCDVAGTWALKITTTVTWPGGVLNAGSGSSAIWARFVGTESGKTLTGALEPCGFTLPDFAINSVVANELYQIDFPDTLFDHVPAYIPTTPLSLSFANGFLIGQTGSIPRIGFQVGSTLANPATDAWPAVGSLATTDLDADGKVGITAPYSAASGHTLPRADVAGSQRADRAYAAARFALSGTGSITSCTQLDGSISFANFDTHVVGCHLASGADCNSTQSNFIDMSRPIFAPGAATVRAVKVAAGATCTAVRSALP